MCQLTRSPEKVVKRIVVALEKMLLAKRKIEKGKVGHIISAWCRYYRPSMPVVSQACPSRCFKCVDVFVLSIDWSVLAYLR